MSHGDGGQTSSTSSFKFLGMKRYAALSERIDEVGRMLGGPSRKASAGRDLPPTRKGMATGIDGRGEVALSLGPDLVPTRSRSRDQVSHHRVVAGSSR